jgi:hypothetical protein
MEHPGLGLGEPLRTKRRKAAPLTKEFDKEKTLKV